MDTPYKGHNRNKPLYKGQVYWSQMYNFIILSRQYILNLQRENNLSGLKVSFNMEVFHCIVPSASTLYRENSLSSIYNGQPICFLWCFLFIIMLSCTVHCISNSLYFPAYNNIITVSYCTSFNCVLSRRYENVHDSQIL